MFIIADIKTEERIALCYDLVDACQLVRRSWLDRSKSSTNGAPSSPAAIAQGKDLSAKLRANNEQTISQSLSQILNEKSLLPRSIDRVVAEQVARRILSIARSPHHDAAVGVVMGMLLEFARHNKGERPVSERPNWDEYFMSIATQVSRRATCDRLHVGCVLTVKDRMVSSGYNGALSGLDHCDDVGHLMVNNHCKRVVHAELNAIAQAARHGVSTAGATAYVTAMPCLDCAKVLINAGIQRIVYGENYGAPDITEITLGLARQSGVEIVQCR